LAAREEKEGESLEPPFHASGVLGSVRASSSKDKKLTPRGEREKPRI